MYYSKAFEILKISATCDKKIIKKAYAELVKQYHPEEQPDEWKMIHDAYETAIRYAKIQRTHVESENVKVYVRESFLEEKKEADRSSTQDKLTEEEERYQKQQQEYDALFASGNLNVNQWKEEKFQSLRFRIKQQVKEKRMKYEDWKALFESAEFKEFRHDPRTMRLLAIVVRGKIFSLKTYLLFERTIAQVVNEVEDEKLRYYCELLLRTNRNTGIPQSGSEIQIPDKVAKWIIIPMISIILLMLCLIYLFAFLG